MLLIHIQITARMSRVCMVELAKMVPTTTHVNVLKDGQGKAAAEKVCASESKNTTRYSITIVSLR